MIAKKYMTIAAIAAIGATVLGTAPAALAYTDAALKRAVITIVLKNLGVEPTASIVDALVAELPIDSLATNLVDQVGAALDAGDDPSLIIGQTVDSDGDGIPNENAALDAEDDDSDDDSGDESNDDSDDDNSTTTKPSKPSKPSNPGNSVSDDDDDDSDDDSEDDDVSDGGESSESHSSSNDSDEERDD